MTEISLKSFSEIQLAIREYEIDTNSKFRVVKKDKYFGLEGTDFSAVMKKIWFKDPQPDAVPIIPSTGVPFIVVGKKLLECHQGLDRDKNRKMKRKNEKQRNEDHDFSRQRRQIQPTKKKNCGVKLRIRHVVRFPDYKTTGISTTYEKDLISVEIKKLVLDKKQINMQHQFYIAFPDPTEHQNHLRGESASLLLGIDDRLKEYIRKMVWEENITSVPQMRVLLEVYMKTTLFQGQDIPAIINKRFWPSNVDIQNHIALAVKKQRNKEIDQEVVVDLLKEWKSERPEDNFHLRLKGDHLEPDNDNSDLELNHGDAQETEDDVRIGEAYTRKLYGTNSKFLYVHQTQWQRRLLELYGKEICLLDATYRTTRYSLPLYFLCVPTNVNYITVGTFVTETEDSASLMEGLQVIKEWNPEWSPKFFMCDYATEEINALENVFPGSFVYLCDFHREQSWERWLTAAHNGLHTEKTNVLSLLRPIARALNEDDFNSALSTLKSSSVWNEKEKLRKWFEKTWLSCPRRWVRAHRQERFNVSVNTNNGIERQNLSLKYEYLDKKKARSLSQLLSVLIRKFLPDSYVKYMRMNVAASDQHKQYDLLVPLFLHNRPKTVVQHCMRRWVDSENSSLNDIDQTSPSTFLVKSFSDINTSLYYEVCFENDDGMPSCQCLDWLEHHLPCKHLMTVFRNVLNCNWDALPSAYRESPYICLDVESFPLDSEADLSTTDDNIVEVTIGSSGDMGEISVSSLPLPPKQQLKKERSKICNLLEITKERCYASENLKLLQKISATLTSLASELRQDLPKEGEFILDTTTESTHIGTNSSKQTDTRRSAVRKLSLSRKRKIPGSGRHGVGAQKKRNSHMKEGINTLIDLVEPAVVEEGVEIILMEDEDTVEILDSRPSQEVSFKNIDRGCAQRPPQGDQSDTVDRGAAPNPPQEDHPLRSGSLNTVMEANHDSEIQLIQETLNMEDICQTEDLSQRRKGLQVSFDDPIEKIRLFQKSSILNPSKRNILLNVGGYMINQQSLEDLDSELPDEVMNAYISSKSRQCKKRSVAFIPCAIITSIFLEDIDSNDPFPSHGYLQQVNLEYYDVLIGAICESENHWCLMVIFPQRRHIIYMNPLGESKKRLEDYLQNWLLFLAERSNRGIGQIPSEGWSIGTKAHRKQMDSNSCGVFTLKFAELILDDDENFKFDSSIRGIRALRHVIGQFLVENSDIEESNDHEQACGESSDISTVYEVDEVSSDNQSWCSKTTVNNGVEPLVQKAKIPKLRKPRITKRVGVVSTEKMSLSSNWLYDAVSAKTEITQRITSGMCGFLDDMPMTIQKGTASVNGRNLASLFEDHVKEKLKTVLEISDGCTSYYSPHWRHIRWVKEIALNLQMEMRKSIAGHCERQNFFGNIGWKELNALVLSAFGTWKQKFKLRVGCGHGYFLTVKDVENGKLLERIESLMSQNLNEGYNYFMDVVFVEAQILIVSHLRGITITEADKLLYPVKKHNEQV